MLIELNFKTHPSVLIIKDNISQENKFSFTEVSQSEIQRKIKNLNYKKDAILKNIPLKVLKTSAMITVKALQQLANQILNTREFSSNLNKCRCYTCFMKGKSARSGKLQIGQCSTYYFQSVSKADAKSDKFTHKIFFVATPVWVKKGF